MAFMGDKQQKYAYNENMQGVGYISMEHFGVLWVLGVGIPTGFSMGM